MLGTGIDELRAAMDYILTEEKASENYLQFSEKDKITIIKFNSEVSEPVTVENGLETKELLDDINDTTPRGGTNIYDTVSEAVEYLDSEDMETYNVSIVLMTDGVGNDGSLSEMQNAIENAKNKIPVYSITFGTAKKEQLQKIADLTSGKVFDGKTNLLEAFKLVRGYN